MSNTVLQPSAIVWRRKTGSVEASSLGFGGRWPRWFRIGAVKFYYMCFSVDAEGELTDVLYAGTDGRIITVFND